MRELRRRLRVMLLRGLEWPVVPPRLVEGALVAASPLAVASRPMRRVRANLELLGGPWDPEGLQRQVARHAARQFATWVGLSRSDGPRGRRGAWLDSRVRCADSATAALEHLRAGRGAVVATAHLGDWEVLAAWLARQGVRGGVVGLERPSDPATAWLARLRSSNGVRTYSHAAPPRELVRLLRQGGCLGILNDLDARRSAQVEIEFLGRPARVAKSPATLARLAGVPIWPLVCVVEDDGWTIHGSAPILVAPGEHRSAAILAALRELAHVQEGWVRRWPGQWAWHQERWRQAP